MLVCQFVMKDGHALRSPQTRRPRGPRAPMLSERDVDLRYSLLSVLGRNVTR
jgi:hypothetical protein